MLKTRASKVKIGLVLVSTLLLSAVLPTTGSAAGYDPNKDYQEIGMRFWEDQQPPLEFYINATNKYLVKTVPAPRVDSTSGEWAVMDLLRGMYTGADYINDIPQSYFESYLEEVDRHVLKLNGILDKNKSTEWSRVSLPQTLLGQDLTSVAGKYDFIDKFSSSYKFSYRQGINGPIWELIALDAGAYKMYPAPSGKEADWNSRGKLIDYIIKKELKTKGNTKQGGWSQKDYNPTADPDITGMVLQAFAPYYLSEERYQASGSLTPFDEFRASVERGIAMMSTVQHTSGAFSSAEGEVNAESIVQVLVGLTALNIDPLSPSVDLPTIQQKVSFVTQGTTGTNNMVDALLTFWAPNSEGKADVSGFKHLVNAEVNGMASEQAAYGLIAYDRYVKKLNSLYDMTDQKDVSYQEFKAKKYTLTYDYQGSSDDQVKDVSYLAGIALSKGTEVPGQAFIEWNTKADGSGVSYRANERLSIPNHDITLYSQYKLEQYGVTYDLSGGEYIGSSPLLMNYTIETTYELPTADMMRKAGHRFGGWYPTSEVEGEAVTHLTKATGAKKYVANWIKIQDSDYALAVDELITEIGEVSLAKEDIIIKVRKAYDLLTATQKELVSDYTLLQEAERMLEKLKAESVDLAAAEMVNKKIEAIGEVTRASQKDIRDARQSYEALSDNQQLFIKEGLAVLTELEKELSALKLAEEGAVEFDEGVVAITPITIEDLVAVRSLRAEYDSLTEAQKTLVSQAEVLFQMEEVLANLIASETAAAQTVSDLIDGIGVVTLASQEVVTKAETLYAELSDFGKKLVSSTLMLRLETAKERLVELADSQKKTAEVSALIDGINESEISVESAEFLSAIQEAFNQLSPEEQAGISEARQAKLVKALKILETRQLERAEIKAVEAAISALPKLEAITLADAPKIKEIRQQLTSLTKSQQEQVTNLSDFLKVEAKIKKLSDQKPSPGEGTPIEDKEVLAVEKAISQLPETTKLTLTDQDQVVATRKAYNALSKEKQADVRNYPTLQAAEKRLKELLLMGISSEVEDVIALIDNLPAANAIKLTDETAILAARKAYNQLSNEEQAAVTNSDKLIAAEQALAKLAPLKKGKPISITNRNRSKNTGRNQALPQASERGDSKLSLIGISVMFVVVVLFKRRKATTTN